MQHPTLDELVAERLGHAAPFSAAELASISGDFVVSRSHDSQLLAQLVGVERLSLTYCDLAGGLWLSQLQALRELELIGCTGVDDGLQLPGALRALTVAYTPLASLDLLSNASHIGRLSFVGPRFADDVWRTAYAHWATNQRSPALLLRSPREDEFMQGATFSTLNLTCCAAVLPNGRARLVVPGPEGRALEVSGRELYYELSDAPSDTLQLLQKLEGIEGTVPCEPELPSDLIERATAEEALAWAGGRSAFIGHFSTQLFYREPASLLAELAHNLGVTFPEWWVRARSTLAMAVPDLRTEVRFAAQTRMPQVWMSISTDPARSEPFNRLLREEGLLCVALDRDAGSVALVIDLRAPDDTTLYRLDPSDLPGGSGRAAMHPAFSSYEAMLDGIHALRVLGTEQIEAQE